MCVCFIAVVALCFTVVIKNKLNKITSPATIIDSLIILVLRTDTGTREDYGRSNFCGPEQ